MSNNKQIKLYTEEQVVNALNRVFIESITIEDVNEVMRSLTPIELPSDEEIEKFANEYVKNKWEYAQDENKESFVDGAKWMRDKIKVDKK